MPKNAGLTYIAWGSLALSFIFYLVGVLLLLRSPQVLKTTPTELTTEIIISLVMLAYSIAGATISVHQPENPLGWLLLFIGLVREFRTFIGGYVLYGLLVSPLPLPALPAAAWVFANGYFIPMGLIPMIYLLFPNGRLPSKAWRPALWWIIFYVSGNMLAALLNPGPLFPPYYMQPNPSGMAAAAPFTGTVILLSIFAFVATLALGMVTIFLRIKGTQGDERSQLKWMAYANLMIVVIYTGLILIWASPLLNPAGTNMGAIMFGIPFAIALAALPVAVGVGILKYHLYDIDLLINRTLVYALLSAILIGLYLAIVLGFESLLAVREGLLVSLIGAGVVAVLFQPLRDRLQRGVNRLLYGERDEPYQALSKLVQRLEATQAADAVLLSITETIRDALKLPYVGLALEERREKHIAAESGKQPLEVFRLPLIYQAETVGELLLAPRRPGDSFTPLDRRLLSDLARQAGVAVYAARVAADLKRSRERLVMAREEERLRIRRDLHDGLGPQLASLTLKLETARNRLGDNPEVDALLAALTVLTQAAMADIRRLVYALRPPALDELGLVPALRAIPDQFQLPDDPRTEVEVTAPPILPPIPAAVEVAIYRIAQEAMTNVIRHAQAETCAINLELCEASGDLCLEIIDDGCGLPQDHRQGIGLQSMRERAEELGGSWQIEPAPGGGTRVSARLPYRNSPQEAPGRQAD